MANQKGQTLLIIMGILLLLGIGTVGLKTFLDRQHNDELINKSGQQSKAFDKTKYPTDKADSFWTVVNKRRPLNPLMYQPSDLVDAGNGQQLRREAATAFKNLRKAAEAAGLKIIPTSGYRSYAVQKEIYASEVAGFGQAVADGESARAGRSEHQTGLAVDVGSSGCKEEACFGDTAESRWVAANSYKYGFIVRYIAGKEKITGYRAEPWHLRYIGKELATEMNRAGITTLEEFFGLPAAPDY